MPIWLRIVTAAAVLGASITAANAADIALATTGAVEFIMRGLIPPFERTSGHKVDMNVLGTGPAVARIKDGAHADLILLGLPALTELAAAGKVNASTVMPAFKSRIGLAVRAGARKPDIRTAEAFKKALLEAKSIGHSIGPSGEHFSQTIIVKLGIVDQVRPKLTVVRGMTVAAAVAKGDVEIGIHQIAELMPIPGIDIVGDLPAELNTTIIYATGLTTMARQPDAVRELVKYLSLPSSVPVIKANGMDPA